ncbi:MAG: alcohol dehydrogenase catalytic domain-containing protein [Desulfurococcales archaeon]|nr:alcohol dehydrogenase catalytic domain-containing protein [Desulfurococcales archaeon]
MSMRAVVYYGPGDKKLADVPKPKIEEPTDAIVKITMTTICGTDLHILKGDLPEVKPGTILGHVAVGIVEEVGTHVKSVKPDDRVLISCITGCGYRSYCRKQMYSHCSRGGWILVHLINGTQAEYVRVSNCFLSVGLLRYLRGFGVLSAAARAEPES